jgi:hypothetical protein
VEGLVGRVLKMNSFVGDTALGSDAKRLLNQGAKLAIIDTRRDTESHQQGDSKANYVNDAEHNGLSAKISKSCQDFKLSFRTRH